MKYTEQQILDLSKKTGQPTENIVKRLLEKGMQVEGINDNLENTQKNSGKIGIASDIGSSIGTLLGETSKGLFNFGRGVVSGAFNRLPEVVEGVADIPGKIASGVLSTQKGFDKLTGLGVSEDYSKIESIINKSIEKEVIPLNVKDKARMIGDIVLGEKTIAKDIGEGVGAIGFDLLAGNKIKGIAGLYKGADDMIEKYGPKVLSYTPTKLKAVTDKVKNSLAGKFAGNVTTGAVKGVASTVISEGVLYQDIPNAGQLVLGGTFGGILSPISSLSSRIFSGSKSKQLDTIEETTRAIVGRPLLFSKLNPKKDISSQIEDGNKILQNISKKIKEKKLSITTRNVGIASKEIMSELKSKRDLIGEGLDTKVGGINYETFNYIEEGGKKVLNKNKFDPTNIKTDRGIGIKKTVEKGDNVLNDAIVIIEDIGLSKKDKDSDFYKPVLSIIDKIKNKEALTPTEIVDFRAGYNAITKSARMNSSYVSKDGKTANNLQIISDDIDYILEQNIPSGFDKIKSINKEYFNLLEFSSGINALTSKIQTNNGKIIKSIENGIDSQTKNIVGKAAGLFASAKTTAGIRVIGEIIDKGDGIIKTSELDKYLPAIFEEYDSFLSKNQRIMDKIIKKYVYDENIDLNTSEEIWVPGKGLVDMKIKEYEAFIVKQAILSAATIDNIDDDDLNDEFYKMTIDEGPKWYD